MYLIILSTKFTAQISRYLDVWSYKKKKREKRTLKEKKGKPNDETKKEVTSLFLVFP